MHSGPFGCVTKLGTKWAELVQKFVPRSRDGIFYNECSRMVWCVLYHLGAFGTVWLPYKTRWKTGRTSANVRATKSCQNFSQQTHSITPFFPKLTFWCISYHLGASRTVWLPHEIGWKTGRTSAKVRATKSRRNFSQRTHPMHPIRP